MKRHFITGLVILLPFALTLWLFLFAINLLTNPFVHVVQSYLIDMNILHSEKILYWMARGLILLFLVITTLLLGFVTRWVVIHSFIEIGDNILHRIPLVNRIYRTAKEVVHTVMKPDATTFKQVVMVPFPHPKSRAIGLITSDDTNNDQDQMITVFVPATPNPTMGYLVLFSPKQIQKLDLTVEQALKAIVSCGLVMEE